MIKGGAKLPVRRRVNHVTVDGVKLVAFTKPLVRPFDNTLKDYAVRYMHRDLSVVDIATPGAHPYFIVEYLTRKVMRRRNGQIITDGDRYLYSKHGPDAYGFWSDQDYFLNMVRVLRNRSGLFIPTKYQVRKAIRKFVEGVE